MEKNRQGIEAIALDVDEGDKSITFWTSEGEQRIPIGYNSMQKGEMIMTGMGLVAAATSGAWKNETSYRITMYNYESPHAVTYDFNFSGNDVIVSSEFNVFRGLRQQPQMKGTIE